MAGREMSRKEMFLRGEKDYLRPLPQKRYVVKERKLMTVGKNSYVSLFSYTIIVTQNQSYNLKQPTEAPVFFCPIKGKTHYLCKSSAKNKGKTRNYET